MGYHDVMQQAAVLLDDLYSAGVSVWLWRGQIHIGAGDAAIEAEVRQHAQEIRTLLADDGRPHEWCVQRTPGGALLYKHPRLYKPAPPAEEPLRMSFGRYRGSPVDLVVEDVGYAEWLIGQGWFARRYPKHHAHLAAALDRTRDDAEGRCDGPEAA